MVTFGSSSGYFNPMDRDYGIHDREIHHSSSNSGQSASGDVGVGIGEIGMSIGLGPVPNVPAVQAKLRPGTKTLELAFMGTGKGSGQGHTPEMYGEKQRQALREMALANRVDFTTHAGVGVNGLAGMDQQGNFSKQQKSFALSEVKRAIEFAGDVGRGGPVVLHTGEFNRPLVDAEWNKGGKYNDKFEMFEDESTKASYKVIDTRTGAVIQEARKDRKVSRPVWLLAKKDKEFYDTEEKKWKKPVSYDNDGRPLDEHGMPIFVDYFDKRVNPEERVPEFDSNAQGFKTRQMDWPDLEKEADDMTLRAKQVVGRYREAERKYKSGMMNEEKWKKAKKKFEDSYWVRFEEHYTPTDQIKVKPEEAFIVATLETNAANSRGWAKYYGGSFDEYIDNMKKLEKAKEFYQELWDKTPEDERWRFTQPVRQLVPGLIDDDKQTAVQLIEKAMRDTQRQITQSQEAASSQYSQAQESVETIRHVESAETYALKESYDGYADLGIKAMRQSDELRKQGKLVKPIMVAMENLFPENYGAHPDELINLVEGSREKMVHLLQKYHGVKSEKEATEIAQKHIAATFDTGHMNMWRKYWKEDPKKSMKENNDEFDAWFVDKVKDMADRKIIGHVHLVDNYGYQDDHLAAGEGNTPIRRILKALKERGYDKEIIVEPAADYSTDVSGFHGMMKTWRHLGSPAYGSGSGVQPSTQTWGDVGYGWFGQTQPPYFTFGAYGPSEDWTLWSGVPLE